MNKSKWLPSLGVALTILFVALSSVTLIRAQGACEPDPLNIYVKSAIEKKMNTKNYTLDPVLTKDIACAVEDGCIRYSLSPELVLAVIEVESRFRPEARSNMNARGLMQVLAKTKNGKTVWLKRLKEEGIITKDEKELHDVRKGVLAGCYVLRYYLNEYNQNQRRTLYAYLGAQSTTYRVSVSEKQDKYASLIKAEREFAQKQCEELAWLNLDEIFVNSSVWEPVKN